MIKTFRKARRKLANVLEFLPESGLDELAAAAGRSAEDLVDHLFSGTIADRTHDDAPPPGWDSR